MGSEEGVDLVGEDTEVLGGVLLLEGVVDRQPVDAVALDLAVDPILDAGELGDVLESLQGVHVEEVVPNIVHLVGVGVEVLSLPLEGGSVGEADVALAVLLVFDLLLGVPLLSKLVDDDGRDNVRQQHFEEPPIDQVGDEAAVVVVLAFSVDVLADDLLGVEGADAGGDRRAVLLDPGNVDIDFLALVQGAQVVTQGNEPEDERKSEGQQTDEHQLLPSESDRLEDALKEGNPSEKEEESEGVGPHLHKASIEREQEQEHRRRRLGLVEVDSLY